MYKSSEVMTDSPLDEDVHCPLCNYNLRGLAEARCPECGGQFTWDELRDPTKRLHPYLFEHHPDRNIWSFFRTLRGGLLPRRFWTTLLPVQPSQPRRLILYWILALVLVIGSTFAEFGVRTFQVYQLVTQRRAIWENYYLGSGVPGRKGITRATPQEIKQVIAEFGSVQNMIDEQNPKPSSKRFFQVVVGYNSPQTYFPRGPLRLLSALQIDMIVLVVLLIWPWCAAGIMLLFRGSMRRSSVRPIHLLRIAIYSADIFVWITLFGILIYPAQLIVNQLTLGLGFYAGGVPLLMWLPILAPFVGLLILTYRLGVAIGKYLRFRHAMAMALSVQIILTLLVLLIFQKTLR
jgi:hypothetical protein